MNKTILSVYILFAALTNANAQFIADKKQANTFSLSDAAIYVDANDLLLVKKTAELLQQDIEMVTGKKLQLINKISANSSVIIIGTIEKSAVLKNLIAAKKINATKLKGKWEAYQTQSIQNPLAGVKNSLVIAGSDRRGAAYGVFELSKQIGVSPWYWWADVPVKKRPEIFIKQNTIITDAPKVKYRGIFINDEAPAFSGWTKEKFGGVNHLVYEKIFELILRLKGNYLWPAMW
ncbi:MAG TPA: glycosyl hydrolase 115 family protein, partial [Chitinophagaceae bacterium]|nr:glycosyl hydrolase 115 family protein [Chitinophagaceae bacterium]